MQPTATTSATAGQPTAGDTRFALVIARAFLGAMADESKAETAYVQHEAETIGQLAERTGLVLKPGVIDRIDTDTLFDGKKHSGELADLITAANATVVQTLPTGHFLREDTKRSSTIAAAVHTTKQSPNKHGKDSSSLHTSSHIFDRPDDDDSKAPSPLHRKEVPLVFQHTAFRTLVETMAAGSASIPVDFVTAVAALVHEARFHFVDDGAREYCEYPLLTRVLTWGDAGDVLAFQGERHAYPAATIKAGARTGSGAVSATKFRTNAHIRMPLPRAESHSMCGYPLPPTMTPCAVLCAVHATTKHLLGIVEAKNELGVSGSAQDQLAAYYFQQVARHHGEGGDMPIFLVGISGPYIHVCAGLTRSHPQVDDLTGLHELVRLDADPNRFDTVVCLFWALRQALMVLANTAVTDVPRWELPFPCMDVVREVLGLGADTELRIVQKLKTQVYRMLVGDKLCVLKFARYYHPQCHEAMATEALAPAIIKKAQLLNWHMVLMEDLPEHWSLQQVIQEVGVQHVHGLRTKEELEATVRPLLETVHAHNMVFGDFRPPNIMVRLQHYRMEEDADVMYKAVDVQLIDFELSGEVGTARPPVVLNPKAFGDSVIDCTSGNVNSIPAKTSTCCRGCGSTETD